MDTVNQMQVKSNLINRAIYVIAAMIILCYIPIVHYYLGPYFVLMCMISFIFLSTINGYPIQIITISIFIFIFIVIHCITNWSSVDAVKPLVGINSRFMFFFPLYLTYYFHGKNENKCLCNLSKLVIFVLVLTSFTTMIGLEIFPGASRYLAVGQSDAYEMNDLMNYNIGGYGFVYSIVIALPLFIYLIKLNKLNWLLILFPLGCILAAQYMYALVLSVIAVIGSSFFKKINYITMAIFIISGCLCSVLLKEVLIDMIYYLTTAFSQYQNLEVRFQEIASFLQYGYAQGDFDSRLDLYTNSINAFLDNPLIGTWGDTNAVHQIGGHAFILDVLGSSGLIGFSAFGLIIYKYYIDILRKLNRLTFYRYVKWSILLFFLLSAINTILTSGQISLVLFFLVSAISAFETKTI